MTNLIPDLRSARPSDLSANIIFFDPSVLDADSADLVRIVGDSARGLFFESDRFFRLRINPRLLEVGGSKITASTFTTAGFERSHFGNDWTRYSYTGSTGYFRPSNAAESAAQLANLKGDQARKAAVAQAILAGRIDITQSPVWQKFRRFEQFYRERNGETVMYYDLRIMRGALLSFNYSEDAENPFAISYRFTFEAHTDNPSGEDRYGKAIRHIGVL